RFRGSTLLRRASRRYRQLSSSEPAKAARASGGNASAFLRSSQTSGVMDDILLPPVGIGSQSPRPGSAKNADTKAGPPREFRLRKGFASTGSPPPGHPSHCNDI